MTLVLAALAGLFGIGLVALALFARRREREAEIAVILDMPPRDAPPEQMDRYIAVAVGSGMEVLQRGIGHLDVGGNLRRALERARIPLRVGEFVLVVAGVSVAAAVLIGLLADHVVPAFVVLALTPVAATQFVERRAFKRREVLEGQLPDFLTLVASSLEAGHSFVRAVQLYAEEAEAPMSEEIDRVLAEAELGDPLVDALERMAERIDLEDLRWIVQAIRIQNTVGGGLAELFHTLADFMRAREEVRLETRALTADARLSAWILGMLPFGLLVVLQLVGRGYLDVMFSGLGLVALAIAGLMAAGGAVLIMRMARIEV